MSHGEQVQAIEAIKGTYEVLIKSYIQLGYRSKDCKNRDLSIDEHQLRSQIRILMPIGGQFLEKMGLSNWHGIFEFENLP